MAVQDVHYQANLDVCVLTKNMFLENRNFVESGADHLID